MLKKLKKAFTITELVIVIAVIAILAAVLIPTFANVIENANQSAALQTSSNALRDYQVIALEDDNPNNDDMAGVVFVSDDYVYAYINSALQYVGKLDDLRAVNSEGDSLNATALENDGTALTFPDAVATDATKVSIDLSTNVEGTWTALDEAQQPADITISKLLAAGEGEENGPKRVENLYFYTITINETNYFGWFTMEVGTTADPAYYQTQGASYSRQYGFAAYAETGTSVYHIAVNID